jgi:hypothetical protein
VAHSRFVETASGRQFQAVLQWDHPLGPGVCLARLQLGPSSPGASDAAPGTGASDAGSGVSASDVGSGSAAAAGSGAAGSGAVAVAVVSEIRGNERGRGIGSDFPAVADALLAALPQDLGVDPATIVWVAHYGEFSSWEAVDAPDAFLRIILDWNGEHYQGDLSGHHHIDDAEKAALLSSISLSPVPEVLSALNWHH